MTKQEWLEEERFFNGIDLRSALYWCGVKRTRPFERVDFSKYKRLADGFRIARSIQGDE